MMENSYTSLPAREGDPHIDPDGGWSAGHLRRHIALAHPDADLQAVSGDLMTAHILMHAWPRA